MARPPTHTNAQLRDIIGKLIAQTGVVPTYNAVRAAIGGPVSRDRLHAALREARLAHTTIPESAHSPQAVAREVATIVSRPLNQSMGYRAAAFAEIKDAVQRTLDALEQSCQQHDAVIAPYISQINQLKAEAAARSV